MNFLLDVRFDQLDNRDEGEGEEAGVGLGHCQHALAQRLGHGRAAKVRLLSAMSHGIRQKFCGKKKHFFFRKV